MAYAFIHIIVAWLAAKIYEVRLHGLSKIEWFFLLLGAVIPDVDFIIEQIINEPIHRTATHSILFALFFASAVFIPLRYLGLEKEVVKKASLCVALGVMFHIAVDMAFHYGVQLFWPLQYWVSFFGFSTQTTISFSESFGIGSLEQAILDMGMGTAWILWLALRQRIRF
ncbi:MAG: metal-dependent hydrolase [Candidatus Nanoarchaeia archaeon]